MRGVVARGRERVHLFLFAGATASDGRALCGVEGYAFELRHQGELSCGRCARLHWARVAKQRRASGRSDG